MAIAELQNCKYAENQSNRADQYHGQHDAEPGSHGQNGLVVEIEGVFLQHGACIDPCVLVSAAVDPLFVFGSEFVQGLVGLAQLFR